MADELNDQIKELIGRELELSFCRVATRMAEGIYAEEVKKPRGHGKSKDEIFKYVAKVFNGAIGSLGMVGEELVIAKRPGVGRGMEIRFKD